MNNLLVFYGELRCFETIIQLYEKYGWLDNYDVFVSAWDTSEGKDVEIEDIMKRYEKINFLFKVTNPYYGNLQRHENCIIYHCKSVFDEIDINQYDNVILQRTDVECRLDMIDFNLITDSVVYRWFDNLQGETTKDGIYNKDPIKYKNAKLIKNISYNDVINKNLQVMDITAISLAKDTKIPIFITNIFKKNSLINVLNRKGSYSKIS